MSLKNNASFTFLEDKHIPPENTNETWDHLGVMGKWATSLYAEEVNKFLKEEFKKNNVIKSYNQFINEKKK